MVLSFLLYFVAGAGRFAISLGYLTKISEASSLKNTRFLTLLPVAYFHHGGQESVTDNFSSPLEISSTLSRSFFLVEKHSSELRF